ncbi:hypothetical protein DL95DRAFT_336775 [Leptodontidium sp. 2 PMI_412]|nr:hypothetical protein DL95DRAFT_336775 [Leptodontidium sp. 2 PMI_412]
MAPNSRPPLTSRIRASFEGRRKSFEGTRKLSKSDSEVNSPLHTNGFITQDPQSIRHAVDQAINGEAFQNAIAANLAKLIKPSIKSALDTIQPVVEAVYSHELLLRKTNQSVEDVLSRMDTNAETAAARRESFIDSTYVAPGTPADGEKSADAVEATVISRGPSGPNFNQFKQLMEEHNAKTLATISESIESNTTKIAELAQGVSDINASIGPTKESIDFLKSASEQATTTSSVLQAQLDQLKADIGQIIEAIGADLGKNIQAISEKSGAAGAELISSHTTKLDLISTDLAALKGHADTVEKIDVISSELVALKASVEAGNAANSEGFASVLGAVGEHATSLIDIKEKAPHPDILAALQKSNDSHALHATTLSELKERSLGSAPAPVVSEGGSVDHSAALQTIQADLTALKENIAAGLTNNTDLEAKIDTVLTTIEEQKVGHPGVEILAAVKQSNESHAAHAAALDSLKPSSADSRSVESAPTESGYAALEGQMTDLIKLAGTTHADALEDIKSPALPAIPAADPSNLAALEIQIGSIISTLETHSSAWNEIKARSDPISTGVVPTEPGSRSSTPEGPFTTIIETLMLHTSLLNEIKEDVSAEILTSLHDIGQVQANQTNLLTEIREADLDDEILTLLHASSESHGNHSSALDKIHAAPVTSSGEAPDMGDLKEKISSIAEKLEEYSITLSTIKDSTAASNDSHAAHATSLDEIKSRSVDAPADGGNIESTDLSALEAHITSIINTLEGQTTTLSSIKEGTATANPDILSAIQASNDLLTSHGQLIESIKEGTSHTDILANISELKSILEDSKAETLSHGALVKDLHTETKDSHSNLASAIGALALGGAAGAGATALLAKDDDSSTAVLDEVKAVRALIETSATSIDATKEKLSSLVSQIEINHTTITTSISTLGDEIKSEIDASGTGVVESISALDGNVKAINLSPLSSSLEQHGADIKSLSAQLETLDRNLKENTTHITSLHNGVHLNDTGVEQLKDHGISRSVAKEPTTIPEGAWFGSARSGSRSPTLSRVVSRSFVEPVQEVAEETLPSTEETPETVSEIVDMQPSTEEPAIEPEVLLDDQPASREIDEASLDTELPKPKAEEAVEADRVLDDSVGIDDADSSAKEPAIESEVSQDQLPETNDVGAPEDLPEAEEVAEVLTATGSLVDENSQGLPIDLPDPVQDVTSNNEGPAPSNEESMPVEEISVPNELDQPEGTELVELELQSGEVAVTDGSAPEFREDHTSTIIETSTVEEESVQGEDLPAESIEKDNLPSSPVPGDDDSPRDDRVASSDIRPRSPLQPLQDDDFRAGQYERYSPEQRSPTEKEPESALASPTSPAFSEGGTIVEKSGGKKKKGKKEKKEKGGGKKGKKEKVPFEMEGEDAE